MRLVVSPLAATTVLAPRLGPFARDDPDVVLDVTGDESPIDLVAAGFDAGIHLGGFIERDMVVIRVSRDGVVRIHRKRAADDDFGEANRRG